MAIVNYIEKHLRTFTVKKHKHLYWEVIYVTEGTGHVAFEDGTTIPYQKGHVICIPPNTYHYNYSSNGFKNIHLTLDAWKPNVKHAILIPESNRTKDLYKLLELTYKYFHLTSTQSEFLFSLTNSLVACLDLLIQTPQRSKISQIIEDAIISNYNDSEFSLERVYASIPYAKEYARKIFVKEHGISPLDFLIEKRIEFAKQLLIGRNETKYTIKEISQMCGFSDQLYFSRCFKKITQISPKNYQLTKLNNNKIL